MTVDTDTEFGRYPEIRQAVVALSVRCDGAKDLDDRGFNGTDAPFGNGLAQMPSWTPEQAAEAYLMLRKYQAQLHTYGIDYDSLPEPELAEDVDDRSILGSERGSTVRWVEWAEDEERFLLHSQYDEDLVRAIRTLPTRRWNPQRKVNTLEWTREAADALSEFVDEHGFAMGPGVEQAIHDAPEPESVDEEAYSVDLSEDGQHFEVQFPYDPEMVNACREIKGRRWDGARKVNTVPVDSCEQVVDFAGRWEIPLTERAAEKVESLEAERAEKEERKREMAERMAERIELSRATDHDLRVEGLGGELMPFQRAGVAYASEAKRAFVADEMGLGKTVEALATLQNLDAFPALVICPASLKLNWKAEAEKWLPGKRVEALDSGPLALSLHGPADVYVINYDVIYDRTESEEDREERGAVARPDLLGLDLEAVILDESHYAKNPQALRTKASRELAKDVEVRLLLTGTPVVNKPKEFVSQLRILGRLDDVGGWKTFTSRYCGAYRDTFGWNMDGARNLDELNVALRGTCYVRRKKEDVLEDLPAKRRSTISVGIDNRREYQKAEDDVIAWLRETAETMEEADAKTRAAMRAEQLVRLNALKQLAARGKLPAVREWISDFLESGEKLVVFGHHREVVDTLVDSFDGAVRISGQDSGEDRDASVRAFQEGDAPVIVCSIRAAGVGLTLTAASSVAFVEQDWTPAAHDQAEDRIHRIGQAQSCTAYYLLADQTIDQQIAALIQEKRAIVEAATDGESSAASSSVVGDLALQLAGLDS